MKPEIFFCDFRASTIISAYLKLFRLLIVQLGFTVEVISPPVGLICSWQCFVTYFCDFMRTEIFLKLEGKTAFLKIPVYVLTSKLHAMSSQSLGFMCSHYTVRSSGKDNLLSLPPIHKAEIQPASKKNCTTQLYLKGECVGAGWSLTLQDCGPPRAKFDTHLLPHLFLRRTDLSVKKLYMPFFNGQGTCASHTSQFHLHNDQFLWVINAEIQTF